MIRVIVWKVLPWKPSKFGESEYMRVAFKPTEGGKQVYLNLTNNTERHKFENWLPYLQEGNVLDVTMHPNGHVNQFDRFMPIDIKDKNKEALHGSVE